MCKIVVWVEPQLDPKTPQNDQLRYLPGDLIQAYVDEHPFTETEKNERRWRILSVPDARPEAFRTTHLEPERDASGKMLRRRAVFFDLNHPKMKEALKTGVLYLADARGATSARPMLGKGGFIKRGK